MPYVFPGAVTPVPPVSGLDDDALSLVISSMGSCFWRCYALGLTDEAMEAFLRDLIDDLPGAAGRHLLRMLIEKPERVLGAIVGGIRTGQILIDIGQGRGPIGNRIAVRLPENIRNQLEEKLSRWLRDVAGRGGRKLIGRVPAKLVPLIGQLSAIKEFGCEAPRCASACRDGKYTDNETWPGIVEDLEEIGSTFGGEYPANVPVDGQPYPTCPPNMYRGPDGKCYYRE